MAQNKTHAMNKVRLKAAAIMRGDEVLERGFKSHFQLRIALSGNGDKREPGDIEGFVTSNGQFVDRAGAKEIAIACGQIGPQWKNATRELLSSDIDW